jgi:two-component system nitrate/nitrite response regulator NarL
MKHKTTIIYAEDHTQFRTAVVKELELLDITVVAQCNNGKELLDELKRWPDVVLLDLDMPVMNGNHALDHITKHWPEIKVLIVSMHYEELLIENYMKRGAKGYISKDAFAGNIELLVKAIKKIAKGETYIHHIPEQHKNFSSRQKEIIPFLVEGVTSKEIADEIGIVERAVEKQKQKIYQKSGGNRAIDFYKYAFSKGLQFLGRGK